jgi:biotin operon repressor
LWLLSHTASSLDDIFSQLPNIHARVLRMLHSRGDEFISCSMIAESTGMSHETVRRALPHIIDALHGTRWCIQRKARRNGGCRLVEVGP